MKKFFDKENFLVSSFEKKAKAQSFVLAIAILLVFLITSFVFMNTLYVFADELGSIVSGNPDVAIKDFLRSLPIYLSLFCSIWTLLLLHATFRRVNDEKWHRSLKKDAICLLAFGGVSILYVLVGLIVGEYSSIVEGSPSAIYPLDSILYSLVFIAIGVFVLVYLKKLEEKIPYVVPGRTDIVTKARPVYCIFVTFWMLIALFGLSGGLYSIFIYDFKHEFVFFGIAVILAYLISPIQLCAWEFFYNEIKPEKKKEMLLPLSLVSLGCSVTTVALYMISLSTGLDAPSNAGFGMFPVAFAASVNIATLIMVFTPLIVSVVALIKGLILRKQQ